MTKLCATPAGHTAVEEYPDLLWGSKVLGDVAYLKLERKYLKIFFFFFKKGLLNLLQYCFCFIFWFFLAMRHAGF